MAFPTHYKYVVIGAGIHGLSTAWHLAKELKSRGLGSGQDILIVDKTGIGAGASGIACGVIRNNYYQPAMQERPQRRRLGGGWGRIRVSPCGIHANFSRMHARRCR